MNRRELFQLMRAASVAAAAVSVVSPALVSGPPRSRLIAAIERRGLDPLYQVTLIKFCAFGTPDPAKSIAEWRMECREWWRELIKRYDSSYTRDRISQRMSSEHSKQLYAAIAADCMREAGIEFCAKDLNLFIVHVA